MELALELKSLQPALPVLIISGITISLTQLGQMETHGWNFLAKPFSLPQLLAKVHTILQPLAPNTTTAVGARVLLP
jgi:DNA-binding NtrC family response regulator